MNGVRPLETSCNHGERVLAAILLASATSPADQLARQRCLLQRDAEILRTRFCEDHVGIGMPAFVPAISKEG